MIRDGNVMTFPTDSPKRQQTAWSTSGLAGNITIRPKPIARLAKLAALAAVVDWLIMETAQGV